ncbi:uncharacterized protein L199_002009 [Kwoniella botswanensis]|uniref:uncharacterized protein n=1 Tax=Kwoniella botswanensis TaxID=1268659 RepID=UPI00315C64E7
MGLHCCSKPSRSTSRPIPLLPKRFQPQKTYPLRGRDYSSSEEILDRNQRAALDEVHAIARRMFFTEASRQIIGAALQSKYENQAIQSTDFSPVSETEVEHVIPPIEPFALKIDKESHRMLERWSKECCYQIVVDGDLDPENRVAQGKRPTWAVVGPDQIIHLQRRVSTSAVLNLPCLNPLYTINKSRRKAP